MEGVSSFTIEDWKEVVLNCLDNRRSYQDCEPGERFVEEGEVEDYLVAIHQLYSSKKDKLSLQLLLF